MNYKILFFLSALISFPAVSQEGDFDKLCRYFGELEKEAVTKEMTKTQKADFINKLVKKGLNIKSSARQAWEVIIYAVPNERYKIIKSTAEEILKTKWQCKIMQKHISTTGK